eukprot:CAMPEP_0202099494 /NCGR_PEP_ID=MMETSP0965-20130614/2544_1 /ASSEMBLY_ACC=CAM_ASM_000507 /TAXON_ID=4773 /ORGANISM="Schizochytrium aggregatum, Strain ATCC28209" /LENGTH=188 /DNA_ID=CAMNT_0048668067 /DNA_START=173 /DNA_END=735 /DNA_ORIENTATION=+
MRCPTAVVTAGRHRLGSSFRWHDGGEVARHGRARLAKMLVVAVLLVLVLQMRLVGRWAVEMLLAGRRWRAPVGGRRPLAHHLQLREALLLEELALLYVGRERTAAGVHGRRWRRWRAAGGHARARAGPLAQEAHVVEAQRVHLLLLLRRPGHVLADVPHRVAHQPLRPVALHRAAVAVAVAVAVAQLL